MADRFSDLLKLWSLGSVVIVHFPGPNVRVAFFKLYLQTLVEHVLGLRKLVDDQGHWFEVHKFDLIIKVIGLIQKFEVFFVFVFAHGSYRALLAGV